MFGVGVACSTDEVAIRVMVAQALRDLDEALELRFELALGAGDVSADADPAQLAAVAASCVHGLSVRARAGTKSNDLLRFIDNCVPMLVARR